jgi:plastocyanin
MRVRLAVGGLVVVAGAILGGCYSSTSNPPANLPTGPTVSPQTPTPVPTATVTPTPLPSGATPTPVPTGTAQPQLVHIGFELLENTDKTYGPVWFYSPTLDNLANVVRVAHGSKIIFINDGTNPTSQHTAGGLGTSFPPSFDNPNRFNPSGSVIDGGTTWSTGTLNPGGGMSQVFTVGAPGAYFFGCGFHYAGPPTKKNQSMGDVIVSE